MLWHQHGSDAEEMCHGRKWTDGRDRGRSKRHYFCYTIYVNSPFRNFLIFKKTLLLLYNWYVLRAFWLNEYILCTSCFWLKVFIHGINLRFESGQGVKFTYLRTVKIIQTQFFFLDGEEKTIYQKYLFTLCESEP